MTGLNQSRMRRCRRPVAGIYRWGEIADREAVELSRKGGNNGVTYLAVSHASSPKSPFLQELRASSKATRLLSDMR